MKKIIITSLLLLIISPSYSMLSRRRTKTTIQIITLARQKIKTVPLKKFYEPLKKQLQEIAMFEKLPIAQNIKDPKMQVTWNDLTADYITILDGNRFTNVSNSEIYNQVLQLLENA